jgi:hypothetical protein
MDVVKNSAMKVEDICVFWFVVSRDGRRLTLLIKNSAMKVEDICVFWFVVSRDGRRLTLLVDHV